MPKKTQPRRGRPPVKSAKKKIVKSSKGKAAIVPNPDDDFFVGGIVDNIIIAGRHIVHPALIIAKDQVNVLKVGQSFAVSRKFKSSLAGYVRDHLSERVYRFAKIAGNDKHIQVFRIK